MTVYLIWCSANKKYYVGQTIEKRLQAYLNRKLDAASRHISKKNHIYSALRKYPLDSFSIEPLAICSGKDEMDLLEKLWIIALNSRNDKFGMNIAVGGEGGWLGLKHSSESLHKMKTHPNRTRGFRYDVDRIEHSKRMKGAGNPMFGKKRVFSEDWLERMRIAQIGRTHSEETKRKMSESAKARWAKGISDEYRANMSAGQKRRFAK